MYAAGGTVQKQGEGRRFCVGITFAPCRTGCGFDISTTGKVRQCPSQKRDCLPEGHGAVFCIVDMLSVAICHKRRSYTTAVVNICLYDGFKGKIYYFMYKTVYFCVKVMQLLKIFRKELHFFSLCVIIKQILKCPENGSN